MRSRLLARLGLAASLVAGALPAHAADPVADFYAGKTVRVLVGFRAGGGYDLYARTLARHMARHIPGQPTLLPQNVPGAGRLKAGHYPTNAAPRDGTALATCPRRVVLDPP